MKRSSALIPALLGVALILTGCSAGGAGGSDSSGGDCLAPGSASDAVQVEGEETEMTLTSETPIASDTAERSVLTEGEGETVATGEQIGVAITYFNGANGEVVQQAPEMPAVNDEAQLPGWLYDAVRCGETGQRVALVVPSEELLGGAPEDAGIENMTSDDSFIVVADFGEISAVPEPCDITNFDDIELLSKAEGTAKSAPDGFPSVELDADGAPTITMPEGADAPEELETATLIEGDGDEVLPGDCVAVNYRGVIWKTGEEFDSSWAKGAPAAFATNGVIGGFQEALEGQNVGSQIISVVPAEDGGYGGDSLEAMGHPRDAVMVFVLDIVGVDHPGTEE